MWNFLKCLKLQFLAPKLPNLISHRIGASVKVLNFDNVLRFYVKIIPSRGKKSALLSVWRRRVISRKSANVFRNLMLHRFYVKSIIVNMWPQKPAISTILEAPRYNLMNIVMKYPNIKHHAFWNDKNGNFWCCTLVKIDFT